MGLIHTLQVARGPSRRVGRRGMRNPEAERIIRKKPWLTWQQRVAIRAGGY